MKERQKLALAGRRMRQECLPLADRPSAESHTTEADLFTDAAGDQPTD